MQHSAANNDQQHANQTGWEDSSWVAGVCLGLQDTMRPECSIKTIDVRIKSFDRQLSWAAVGMPQGSLQGFLFASQGSYIMQAAVQMAAML